MKTEIYIKKENSRRMDLLAKSRLHYYLVIALILIMLTSCKGTHYTVAYAIKTEKTTYYCNHAQFDEKEQLIRGAELKRDGKTIRQVFEIPFDSVVWVTFNDHKYEWK